VMGCGHQKGYSEMVRSSKVDITMVPKLKFEIVVSSAEWAEKTIKAIEEVACTGKIGDGKIFVYELDDVIRIRTGERGNIAI
jgi:nitrogen regulatory protein P-II 1